MKKIVTILIIFTFILSGCSLGSRTETGRIISIDNNILTVELGTTPQSNSSMGEFNGSTPPDMTGDMGTPPDLPNGENNEEGNTPPDLPEDIQPGENSSSSTPPDLPSFNDSDDRPEPPDVQSGATSTDNLDESNIDEDSLINIEIDSNTISEYSVGEYVEITFGLFDRITNIEKVSMNMKSSGANFVESANTLDSDTTVEGQIYTSTNEDENALRVTGATVTANDITIEKSGKTTSEDDSNFYGLNAGLLVVNEANLSLNNSLINTKDNGANGIFIYGANSILTVKDTTITTGGNNAGGIDTSGGGTTTVENCTVTTNGNSSAPIRSDRGGGTVNVNGGTYESNGTGSPAIYSTADITAENCELTSNNSEAIVIEGKNSVNLINCITSGDMKGTYNDSTENIQGVMIYQSMSGDAEVGESHFRATGGSLTTLSGDLIYITNTSCTVDLNGVDLTLANENFINISGNNSSRGWGKEGENGGNCTLTLTSQSIDGDILVDEISTLNLTISDESNISSTINNANASQNVIVTINDNSQWNLTGDSYISEFNGNLDQVNTNGYSLFVNGEKVK